MSRQEPWDLSKDRRGADDHALAMTVLRGADSRQDERSSLGEGSVTDDPKAGGGGG